MLETLRDFIRLQKILKDFKRFQGTPRDFKDAKKIGFKDFGLRNQDQEAQGTQLRAQGTRLRMPISRLLHFSRGFVKSTRFPGEPGAFAGRHRLPVYLEPSKNPL